MLDCSTGNEARWGGLGARATGNGWASLSIRSNWARWPPSLLMSWIATLGTTVCVAAATRCGERPMLLTRLLLPMMVVDEIVPL